MVDVPLRHKRSAGGQATAPQSRPSGDPTVIPTASRLRPGARTPRVLLRPIPMAIAAVIVVVVLIVGLRAAMNAYYESAVLSGFTADTTPVELVMAGEPLAIPANMIRSARTRRGGDTERVELAVHWPSLGGFSEDLAEVFRGESGSSPVIYLSISAREMAADSTGRLADVYARFFVGPASPGPNGLVGRQLSDESGYGGEIIYFTPAEAYPFVARCIADPEAGVPATCLRDINVGGNLMLLYRFDRSLLAEWAELDAGMRGLATGILAR